MAKVNSTGLLDKTLFQLIKQNLINVVYDIGANKGDWTKKYSKKLPGVEFHMFEAIPGIPSPSARGNWHNVALSNNEADARDFFISPYFCGAGNSFYKENSELYKDESQKIRLQTHELDKYSIANGISLPDFIKIDTQGSELDILEGATECLNNCIAVMSEVPILKYNKGAPQLPDYIHFMKAHSLVPIGIEEIHILDSMLVQVDVLFVKENHYKSSLKEVNPIGWNLGIEWDYGKDIVNGIDNS